MLLRRPLVLVDQYPASYLVWLIDLGLAEARRHGAPPVPPMIADVIAEIREVAAARQAEAIGRCGSSAEHDPVILTPMTSDQAAKALGCTTRNVTDLVARGSLRARKAGRSWQIDPVSVRELHEERTGVGS